jgi:hypothetical protein
MGLETAVTVIKAASKKVATSLPPIVEPSFVETDPNIKVLYGRWSSSKQEEWTVVQKKSSLLSVIMKAFAVKKGSKLKMWEEDEVISWLGLSRGNTSSLGFTTMLKFTAFIETVGTSLFNVSICLSNTHT